MDLREIGSSYALNLTFFSNMILCDLWIRYKQNTDFKDMIFWYDSSCYRGIFHYLKIGVPGMLMVCLEWWAFEILAIFSGLIGVKELAS